MTDRMTIRQACEMFAVTTMTLYLWRKGTPTRAPLPVEKPRAKMGEGANSVLMDPAKLEKWAAAHEVPIVVPAAKVLKQAGKNSMRRRGPKPKLA